MTNSNSNSNSFAMNSGDVILSMTNDFLIVGDSLMISSFSLRITARNVKIDCEIAASGGGGAFFASATANISVNSNIIADIGAAFT